MALFKIQKGLKANLAANRPKANEGWAYFTTDDGKFYIDIAGDGTQDAVIGTNRICLNAAKADQVGNSLIIKLNGGTTEGTNQFTFNGSAVKTINIAPASIGALPSGGTAAAASKVVNKLTLKFDSGSTEGTNLYTFDGSGAKTIDIKPGTGLSISSASGAITLNHSNSVTAKTAAAQSAKTLSFGSTFTIYEEKYDAQGHITGVASYNMTMPSNPNTDYRVKQTNSTSNVDYRLLLSYQATNDEQTNQAYKSGDLIFNPSTGLLSTKNIFITGNINKYQSATSTTPMISLRSNNMDAYLWSVGHATSANGGYSNNYRLLYKGTGTSPNNYLQLYANNSFTDTLAMQINENGLINAYEVNVGKRLHPNVGTATAAVTSSPYKGTLWTFNMGISKDSLTTGDTIMIQTPNGGHDYGVFISVDNGVTYKPISVNFSSRLTTHYGSNCVLLLTYDAAGTTNTMFGQINSSGTVDGTTSRVNVAGGCWKVTNYYADGNPGDWNLRQYNILAKNAITAVHIIGGTDSGYSNVDGGTAFDIRYAILYASAAISAGSAGSANFIHHYSINVRNSSNSNISFTAYKNVYIKGTISGNMFTPISGGNPFVQDITASDDGYAYYYIGRAYTTTAITFDTTGRDIFVYKNGGIQRWGGYALNASQFDTNKTIALTGDITGSASSKAGWSIATTIGAGKVTNTMLAGSIANNKLANSAVTIAGNSVSLGGSLTADTLRTSLGLSNAMHFIGVATVTITDGSTTDPQITGYTFASDRKAGDVVIDADSAYEYVWTLAGKWERLGGDSSYKTTQTAITDSTGTSESTTATRFVYSVSQDTNGVISVKTRPLPTYNNYSLPLAANGTRGGIQIGYAQTGKNYPVQLSSEKAFVNVPWTDRYVNSASFADDTTNTAASPVKMTLTRAGSDTTSITANIPKVSSSSAGVAPKGAAVSSQSQSTKFLREDGTWAAPSYTTSLAWGSITGKPSTYAPSAHTHYELATIGDQRSTATTPNTYANRLIFQGLKGNSTIGSPSSDTYSYLVGLRGWADASGGNAHELAFNNTGIYWRNGATTTWNSWNRVVTNSGTWSINVTGNAATATKATQDESGNNIKANYAHSFSISDHTITLKNMNGASLGTVTVPDNNNYVNQSQTTTSNWRKVLLHYTDQSASTATTSNVTNVVYGADNVAVQPSTGTVRASKFNILDKVTLEFDTTNQCLNFVFA